MFGGIFPSQWSQPIPRHWKSCKSLANRQFLPMPSPIKIKRPKVVYAHPELEKAINSMPECELCLNEPPIDTTEIDKMLEEIDDVSVEAKKKRTLQIIDAINQDLSKTIQALQNSPTADEDNISTADLLKLLQMFLNYSRTLEDYCKRINQETKPSLH